ncbi:uncharacterized protein L969DRAFT_51318 [Mixia osmundae IAM 14324]|uniref:Cytochrome b-c1 complex subunit 8 n=1 Tax=Mixia osmundae (strain CBS 9802 / IAM 14324 / JCM 22182 / KY 12970) TaxID=764103 RepID=G7E7N3_MIXOS|nr:uncharacterized protein L969DRAFT_51318 [Mixia osmundae IAM 14324]KEI38443.1 hypothetical protein L969DRAFT_51318 [Mixia osmundae IAM 14324]GAA98843.1 hypothetical protein E5Q_05531 [Mixia osmundae IAM 14324]
MHSTAIVQSGMPTGKSYLSYWGEAKMKQKGVIQYGISPYRQAPMRGAVTHALFSGVGRIRRYAFWPTLAGIAGTRFTHSGLSRSADLRCDAACSLQHLVMGDRKESLSQLKGGTQAWRSCGLSQDDYSLCLDVLLCHCIQSGTDAQQSQHRDCASAPS